MYVRPNPASQHYVPPMAKYKGINANLKNLPRVRSSNRWYKDKEKRKVLYVLCGILICVLIIGAAIAIPIALTIVLSTTTTTTTTTIATAATTASVNGTLSTTVITNAISTNALNTTDTTTTTMTTSTTTTVCPNMTCAFSSIASPMSITYGVEHLDINCTQTLSNMNITIIVQRTSTGTNYANQYQTFWNLTTDQTYTQTSSQIIYTWTLLNGQVVRDIGFPYFVEGQFNLPSINQTTNLDTYSATLTSICGHTRSHCIYWFIFTGTDIQCNVRYDVKSMDENTFSLEEIRRELARLGYGNLSKQTLSKFQQDLEELAQNDRNQNSQRSSSQQQSNVDFTIHQPKSSDDDYNRNTYNNDDESLDETNTPTTTSYHYRPRINEDDNRSDTSSQKIIKRKVLRHYGGKATVCDESRSDSGSVLDSRDVSYLNEHKRSRRRIESASDLDDQSIFSDDVRSTSSIHPVKSFIRPSTASTASLRRSRSFSNNNIDSVQLYSYYRQQWASQRAPGEKSHQSLRWAVRDQLLQKDVPIKRKSVPRVNNYIVPTAKKRSALRWNVRYSLANGLQPSKNLDDFLY